MQHDEVVWQLINHGHCAFRTKTVTQNFCRNDYNVTGLCSRSSCPLANSRYATIREHEGRIYLYIKTAERAHAPKRMWQKIRLKKQYSAALEQIDEYLAYWPKFLVHKNKQRLTKVTQYLVRMRKLRHKIRPKLLTMPARQEKNLRKREAKAEVAAQLEKSIEKELLERLKSGMYCGQSVATVMSARVRLCLARMLTCWRLSARFISSRDLWGYLQFPNATV